MRAVYRIKKTFFRLMWMTLSCRQRSALISAKRGLVRELRGRQAGAYPLDTV